MDLFNKKKKELAKKARAHEAIHGSGMGKDVKGAEMIPAASRRKK